MIKQKGSPGWFLHRPTMSSLIRDAVSTHAELANPDAILSIETHLFNVRLYADNSAYDLDVGKDLWLNVGRWSRLMREYVSRESVDRLVSQACEILSGSARDGATANMMFRDPDRHAKKHRWGGCLMAATFRGDNKKAGPPTLTFFSRTTYMGYMGLLDAAIAAVIAKQIKRAASYEDPIAFQWLISSQQLHCFKTLPYIYTQKNLYDKLMNVSKVKQERDCEFGPTWRHLANWQHRIHRDYKEFGVDMIRHEKYGPFKRVKRRWLEHIGKLKVNIPPSLLVKKLTFDKCE